MSYTYIPVWVRRTERPTRQEVGAAPGSEGFWRRALDSAAVNETPSLQSRYRTNRGPNRRVEMGGDGLEPPTLCV
jgi:hypothetical protein